jgi:hypothetical protein
MPLERFVGAWLKQMLVSSRCNLYRERENQAMDLKHITSLALGFKNSNNNLNLLNIIF